jgi:hypothetical protein
MQIVPRLPRPAAVASLAAVVRYASWAYTAALTCPQVRSA